MPRLARMVACIRWLLAASMIGVLAAAPAVAAQSDQTVEIQVRVLPPDEGDGGPSIQTATTTLAVADPLPSSYVVDGFLLGLVIIDGREAGVGWEVNLMQATLTGADDPLVLHHYPASTRAQPGWTPRPLAVSPGSDLSIGQPLDRMTPVTHAAPDAGTGTYGIRIAVASTSYDAGTAVPLIVSMTAAP